MNDALKAMIESLSIIAFTLIICAAWLFTVVQVATLLKG